MNTNYINYIELIVVNPQIIINELTHMFKNIKVIPKKIMFLQYFDKLYEIYYNNILIIKLYPMRKAVSFNKNWYMSNFHTTVFFLLYKNFLENNKDIELIKFVINLLITGYNHNLNKQDELFSCFQPIFIKNTFKYLININNKLVHE